MIWPRWIIVFISIFFGFIMTPEAYAHHLWAVKKDGSFVIARGIIPDRFDAYDPECVKEVRAFAVDGREIPLERENDQDRVRVQTDGNIALLAVFSEWGYRVITPDGKQFLTQKEALDKKLEVIESFFSSHFAKTFFHFGEALTKPVGLKFELVPLGDPMSLKPGDKLPLKVLFDGAPLESCRVRSGKIKDLMITNTDGIVEVKLAEKGLQLVSANHRIPAADRSDIDYLVFTTFLVFEIK